MSWFKTLFSFKGASKRSELLRKFAGCGFLVWVAAIIDEQLIGPYLCRQDPLKIGCIPGEVKENFAVEDFIAVMVMMVLVAIPLFAVMVRRLHDHGKSGWWLLAVFTGVGVLPLIYWFLMRAPKSVDDGNT